MKLLLQPNDAIKIPGLKYPVEDVHQQPDIAKALEMLDSFPSRIDPVKVCFIFLALKLISFTNKDIFFVNLDVADFTFQHSITTAKAILTAEHRILCISKARAATIAWTSIRRALAGNYLLRYV